MIKSIEITMYQLSDFFMAPVLILLALLFIYSLFSMGAFFAQMLQRKLEKKEFLLLTNTALDSPIIKNIKPVKGYPLVSLAHHKPSISRDELDVAALENMETVRTVSRLAPMLGLIATMIPMGPALKSLADGNVQGISENLIIAFSAVIFGLVIASITFYIATIKKRWLAGEIIALTPLIEQRTAANSAHEVSHAPT